MKTLRTLLLTLIALPIASQASLIYSVHIGTSGLTPGASYFLDFQFIGSNGNTVNLTNFSYSGGTGQAGPVELDTNTNFFNEVTEPFTAGAAVDFQLLSTNVAPPANGFPDELSLFILDSAQNPLTTGDAANAFLYFDLNGGAPNIQTFSGSGVASPIVRPGSGVPEPGTISLLGAGLCAAALLRMWGGRPPGRRTKLEVDDR